MAGNITDRQLVQLSELIAAKTTKTAYENFLLKRGYYSLFSLKDDPDDDYRGLSKQEFVLKTIREQRYNGILDTLQEDGFLSKDMLRRLGIEANQERRLEKLEGIPVAERRKSKISKTVASKKPKIKNGVHWTKVGAIATIVAGVLTAIGLIIAINNGRGNPPPVSPQPSITSNIDLGGEIPSPSPTPAIFSLPTITQILSGVDLPGYSKQPSIVRNSEGKLTLFIRYPNGNLAFTESIDKGDTWSPPSIFDQISPPGVPQLSAVIDSADRIHIVWGRAPEAGNANYGLLDDGIFLMNEVIGTGVFARDIAVDSASHPHIVWTITDLYHTTYNGQTWFGPERAVPGAWHPDIQINANDDIFLFMNNGRFYATLGVAVYAKDNVGGQWNDQLQISTSPFWSGGAAAAIDSNGDIYLVWIGATSDEGGSDQVFFSRNVDGEWQSPFPIGDVNWSATSTGQESPAIAFDANDVLYVFWRGLNDRSRPIIFARALATENSKVTEVTWGWSPIIEIDDRNASDVWWPSVADMWRSNRVIGVDVVWSATVGNISVIDYSHVQYP